MYQRINLEQFPSNETARDMMTMVSPIYERSYVGKWIFQVLGLGIDEVKDKILDLYHEAFPESSDWALKYWEERYGISTEDVSTLADRRMAVLDQIRAKHPINPHWLANELYEYSGHATEIIERTAPFHFTVHISEGPENIDFEKLIEIVDKYKPAHLSYGFRQDTDVNLDLTYGCVEKYEKTLAPKEKNIPNPISGIGWFVTESEDLLLDENGNVFIFEEVT